jgi:hypothetical protein
MRRLKLLIGVLVTVSVPLAALCGATPAAASAVSSIYRQCEQNGQLTGNFSRAELQAALHDLPAEVSEYSECQDVIQQALLRASSRSGAHQNTSKAHIAGAKGGKNGDSGKGSSGGGAGGPSGKGGSGAGTAGKGSDSAVNLAGSTIRPGSTGAGGTSSTLPLALVVVLILLALTAVSGGAVAIRRRVVARHST